jgi:hypothetical protein
MIHFRCQRGSLEESLKTMVEIGSRGELVAHLRRALAPLPVSNKSISVRYYGFDERIGWPTYLVTVKGEVAGFTDGKI